MVFTALHRLLGHEPGPLTEDMIDEAVDQGIAETGDLDWKAKLPPRKGLPTSDFPKDIAAMANSGGGTIVYGVTEEEKAATGRVHVGDVDETYERSLVSVAVSAISPPVFGVRVHVLGDDENRAVAVVVPRTVDGPHLIYRHDMFGAPMRNGPDTVWMRESQVAAMYRTRFDEQRDLHKALDSLYDEMVAGKPTHERAWMIGVARPRVPVQRPERMDREESRQMFSEARDLASSYANTSGIHPIEYVDHLNPRPGLRRWLAPTTIEQDTSAWKEAWASVHFDGSTTLVGAVGGAPKGPGEFDPGWRVESSRCERFVADLMALVRAVEAHFSAGDYELRVGIEWTGDDPLVIATKDQHGFGYEGTSTPLSAFTPIRTTIQTDVDDQEFAGQLLDLALDVVNHGGISHLRAIKQH